MRNLMKYICIVLAVAAFTSITMPVANAGDVTKCRSVWKQIGDSIMGGMAGHKSTKECFSGGGKKFCAGGPGSEFDHQFECAGAEITGDQAGELWAAFDYPGDQPPIPTKGMPTDKVLVDMELKDIRAYAEKEFPPPKPIDEMTADELKQYKEELAEYEQRLITLSSYLKKQAEYHDKTTTRDETRGRAAKNESLYLNQFDICRVIHNSSRDERSLPPLFIGVKTPEEWKSVHGSTSGNNGYNYVANNSELPRIEVCCKPQMVRICGESVNTNYITKGETVQISSGEGYAEVTCVSNNRMRVSHVNGTCGKSNGGGNDRGYSDGKGGHISENDARSKGVPPGYKRGGPNVTNAKGKADLAAMKNKAIQNVKEEETEAERQQRLEEEAKKEAERKAKEAERKDDGYGNK